MPYDPAILLLGIYSDRIIIQKDICFPIFIAALLPIAKTWKQLQIPQKGCTLISISQLREFSQYFDVIKEISGNKCGLGDNTLRRVCYC